jgi:ankyrin repeat protein
MGNSHPEVIKELLDRKAMNISGRSMVTPLMLACKLGKTNELKVMLAAKFSVNDLTSNNKSAMYYACKRMDERMVEMLLKAGANPSVGTPKGVPLMMFVLEKRAPAIAMLLLKFKPDCCHVRSPITGDTPLHLAAQVFVFVFVFLFF